MTYTQKSPSAGTPSVYSHVTSRSSANLKGSRSRSLKSLRVPWYKKPLVQDAIFLDVQRASLITGFFSVFLSLFTIITGCFDLYCYSMAAPGSTHYGFYLISYQFVYVGNRHVRNALVMFAVFSILGAAIVFVTSIMLIVALRKEYEKKILPWLISFGVFTIFRFLAFFMFSIVNDLIFAYNVLMVIFWTIFLTVSIYGWILVYSLYIELSDLTKLEDLAHLRTVDRHFDGHYAVPERFHDPFSGRITTDDSTQHCVHDASQLEDFSPKNGAQGPSRSISFFTDTDNSTISTIPIDSVVHV